MVGVKRCTVPMQCTCAMFLNQVYSTHHLHSLLKRESEWGTVIIKWHVTCIWYVYEMSFNYMAIGKEEGEVWVLEGVSDGLEKHFRWSMEAYR